MKIDALTRLLPQPASNLVEFGDHSKTSFASWLGEQITSTNNQLNEADHALQQLASGHAANLHQTMIIMEQAKLSFQYMEQIRNRLMNAYQDLLREQI